MLYQCRDRYTKKCQQLERENDEQKDKLNEMVKNEKNYVSAYQKSTKKYESLSKQLEAAEIEVYLFIISSDINIHNFYIIYMFIYIKYSTSL